MSVITRVRNRIDRLAAYRWRNASYVSASRPIIIGGCPRSGTTLLRRILDTHPDIACGPESTFFLPGRPLPARLARGYGVPEDEVKRLLRESDSQGAFIDAFMKGYTERVGVRRWAEKTPLNIRFVPWIWAHFPEARFVHIIRDGRDTVCSMRVHADRKLVSGEWVRRERVQPLEPLVRRWVHDVRLGKSYRGDPRYVDVRYEDLVQEPRPALERLFRAVGEPFDERVMEYRTRTERVKADANAEEKRETIHGRSIERWRTDLSEDEQALVKRIAGPLLIELGYAADNAW